MGARAKPKQLGQRVVRGTLWGAINMASGRILQFFTTIIVARMLAPEHFGALAIALVIQVIATNMAELGATVSLARGNSDPDRIAPTVATIALITSAVMTSVAILTAPLLAAMFGDPAATPVIQVMSLTILLQGLCAVPSTMVWREFLQGPRIFVDIANLVTILVLVVPMAGAGWGAMALAWSRVGGQIVATVGYWIITPKRYYLGFSKSVAVEVLRLGMPLAMANLVVFVTLNLDYFLLGRMAGPVVLGMYLLAFNLASLPSAVISSVIRSVAVPTFGRLHADGVLGQVALRFVSGISYIAFPISALLIALGGPLIVTAYGEKWQAAAAAMIGLGLFGAAKILTELFADFCVGAGRTMGLFWIQVIWLVVLAPAMYLGISWHGATGAGLAHAVVAWLVVVPLYILMIRNVLGVSPWRTFRASILSAHALASLACGIAAWVVSKGIDDPALSLVAGGLVGVSVYASLTFRSGYSLVRQIRQASSNPSSGMSPESVLVTSPFVGSETTSAELVNREK